jgi:hypothetical protein
MRSSTLGNAHPIQLTNLVRLIEDSLGSPAVIEHQPEQSGDVRITYANIDKARRLLGYQPKVAIGEGIERFCSWYLREPDLTRCLASSARGRCVMRTHRRGSTAPGEYCASSPTLVTDPSR